MGSLNRLVLELNNVFLRNAQILQLVDLLLFDLFNKNLLGLPGLLELFVLQFLLLVRLLAAFVLVDDLLLELVRMLLQKALSLFLQLFLNLLELTLLSNCCFKLSLLSLSLLFKPSFLFNLLLSAGLLQFLGLLWPDLSFYSILISCCAFVGLNCSFGPQSIELSLSVRSLLLKLSEPLDLFFLLLFDASK